MTLQKIIVLVLLTFNCGTTEAMWRQKPAAAVNANGCCEKVTAVLSTAAKTTGNILSSTAKTGGNMLSAIAIQIGLKSPPPPSFLQQAGSAANALAASAGRVVANPQLTGTLLNVAMGSKGGKKAVRSAAQTMANGVLEGAQPLIKPLTELAQQSAIITQQAVKLTKTTTALSATMQGTIGSLTQNAATLTETTNKLLHPQTIAAARGAMVDDANGIIQGGIARIDTIRQKTFADLNNSITNARNTAIYTSLALMVIGVGYKYVSYKINNRYTSNIITDSSIAKSYAPTYLAWNFKKRAPKFLSQNALMSTLVLSEQQYTTLEPIIQAAYNITNTNLPSVLLYGPAHTGKTTFAHLLADHAGMHYLKIDAASMAPFIANNQIATELNKLFEFAATTRAGTLMVIDDVDILCHNTTACATLLSCMQKYDKKRIMIVCTTNHIEQCSAINNHFSLPPIHFPTPDTNTTKKILEHSITSHFPSHREHFIGSILMENKEQIASQLAASHMTAPKINTIINLIQQQSNIPHKTIDNTIINNIINAATKGNISLAPSLPI